MKRLMPIVGVVFFATFVNAAQPARFTTDEDNVTVNDRVTGLVWQARLGPSATWEQANTYCQENPANLPGTGWRLPGLKELTGIVDYSRQRPALPDAFGTAAGRCWSATSNAATIDSAWTVSFDQGMVEPVDKTDFAAVRCVR